MLTSAKRSRSATGWGSARSSDASADGQHTQQMVPAASGTRLDDIRSQRIGSSVELGQLGCGRYAPAVGRQSRAEDVGDEEELLLAAYGTGHRRRRAHVACGTNEFGVGVAHLVLAEPTAME